MEGSKDLHALAKNMTESRVLANSKARGYNAGDGELGIVTLPTIHTQSSIVMCMCESAGPLPPEQIVSGQGSIPFHGAWRSLELHGASVNFGFNCTFKCPIMACGCLKTAFLLIY